MIGSWRKIPYCGRSLVEVEAEVNEPFGPELPPWGGFLSLFSCSFSSAKLFGIVSEVDDLRLHIYEILMELANNSMQMDMTLTTHHNGTARHAIQLLKKQACSSTHFSRNCMAAAKVYMYYFVTLCLSFTTNYIVHVFMPVRVIGGAPIPATRSPQIVFLLSHVLY
jgi:hypothetical protein